MDAHQCVWSCVLSSGIDVWTYKENKLVILNDLQEFIIQMVQILSLI